MGLVGEVQKKNSWVLYLIFILFICFVVGFAYINLAVKREDRFEDYYLPWLIFIVAFEYLLCLFCVYNFATNVFVQEKIMNQCDFKKVLFNLHICEFIVHKKRYTYRNFVKNNNRHII